MALKAPVLRQALRLVKDAVDQNTIVVSVMNGISSEDIIAEELGLKKIVHCVAQRMDALFQNNTLTYRTFGELVIGLSPQNRSQICRIRLNSSAELKCRIWSTAILFIECGANGC